MMLSQVTFSEHDVMEALKKYAEDLYGIKHIDWDYDDIHYEGMDDRMLTIGLTVGIDLPKKASK